MDISPVYFVRIYREGKVDERGEESLLVAETSSHSSLGERSVLRARAFHELAKKAVDSGWDIKDDQVKYSTAISSLNGSNGIYVDPVSGKEMADFRYWYNVQKQLISNPGTTPAT